MSLDYFKEVTTMATKMITELEILTENVGENPGYALEVLQMFAVLYILLYAIVVIFIVWRTDWKLPLSYIQHDRKKQN